MPSNMLQLDCTVQARTSDILDMSTQRIRGVIPDAYGCEYPVYYYVLYKRVNANEICIEGVAGFDSEYEKGHFTWTMFQNEKEVHIRDWNRFLHVDGDMFAQYSKNIVYTRGERRFPPTLHRHSIPYYCYPRTCDGPLLPQLVRNVIGSDDYTIVFMEGTRLLPPPFPNLNRNCD